MLSWVDELIGQYTVGRQGLGECKGRLNKDDPTSEQDLKHINSMISDMTFSLEWMKTGRQPGTFRGVDEKSVYQRRSYENVDLIPDIAEQLREENDINKKHLFMTREEKIIMADILSSFSLRERQCYLLHTAQGMSWSAIAEELGISKSTVQQSINRARKKVNKRLGKESMTCDDVRSLAD